MRRDALSRAGKAQSFLGRSLDTDGGNGNVERRGNVVPHPVDVRTQFRSLHEHGRIRVADGETRLAHPLCDLPERLNTSALLQVLNTFVSYDEYRRAADAIREDMT